MSPVDESLRYNEVQFKASHNSYANDKPLGVQLKWSTNTPANNGCRGLELDIIQSGDLERFSVNHSLIYHHDGPQFSDYLAELLAWSDQGEHDVVTITVDIKRIRHGDSFATKLDAYITEHFDTGRVFRPNMLMMDGCELVKSANSRGWPSLRELKDKFIFVLSGREKSKRRYAESGIRDRLCFADRSIRPGTNSISVARGNRVFLNFSMNGARNIPVNDYTYGRFTSWDVNQLFGFITGTKGFVTRGYGLNNAGDWAVGKQLGINVLATDALQGKAWAKVGNAPYVKRGFRELA